MRPIRLLIAGFTAFRDRQEIDFDELDLFAISGPTGSGKTSVLDAITYALYGRIERVGNQAGQFISQGQKRMSVELEFAVGNERYHVTRTTPASGATTIMLERWAGEEWKQVGEGADRVKGANEIIRNALGLDYESFTRTVLLPQGKFAQFLSGDAKQRRDILTELLGLELFERLARRAGEIRREADAQASAKEAVLGTEYVGVSPDAVRDAEREVEDLSARDRALVAAEKTVRELAKLGVDAERSVKELRSCSSDAERDAGVATAVGSSLSSLAEELSDAERLVKEAAKEARAAEKEAVRAKASLAKAEEQLGTARELERLRARAEGAGNLAEQAQDAEAELLAARRLQPKLERAVTLAQQALDVAAADAEAAILDVESARHAEEEANHADLVAAVSSGLKSGDACPVCGREIDRLPKARRAPTIEKAKTALAKAVSAAAKTSDALSRARASRDDKTRDLADAGRATAQQEKEVARLRRELSAIGKEVAAALGGKPPADPLAAVDERLERLEGLDRERDAAQERATESGAAAVAAERERDAVGARVGEERARLEALAVPSVWERARSAAGDDLAIEDLPAVGKAAAPSTLARVAGILAERLSSLAGRLNELADARSDSERTFLAEAHAATAELVEPERSLPAQVEAVAAARAGAARASTAAELRADQLRTKLENLGRLTEDIAAYRHRAARFDALARELQRNRIISFLQVEALQTVAASGSDRLATLSSGRYRLAFEDDEFFVVDTWNGEERRSVRTLSGGETFLASLSLALALSEEVRSLSVGERARLDSLFLDEGFGTLDPDSLDVVIDAIEQLGGDGRMVGVITHVQELAIRLPARIEVEKSPRGSRLKVVAAE
jgi:exonuclease SbcC